MKTKTIKKYHLKENIKTGLFFGAMLLLIIATIKIYLQRIDAINNGDLVLVKQNAD